MGQPFCLEVLTEELPPSEIHSMIEQLFSLFSQFLLKQQIPCLTIQPFTSARRIGVWIDDIALSQDDFSEKKRGPARSIGLDDSGQPTRALSGFLKSNQASMDDVVVEDVNGVPYLFLERMVKGKPTKAILDTHMAGLIGQINFKRPMRWGSGQYRFVRPVHNLLCLLGDEIIAFEAFGLKSSRQTLGHRINPGPIQVKHAADYKKNLLEHGVVVELEERMTIIRDELEKICRSTGKEVLSDEDLIWEIAVLTEHPVPILGALNSRFLTLPSEVLMTTLKHHQRAFPLMEGNRPSHQWVAFGDCQKEALENARKGYERVIHARLEDALFYYRDDMKITLEERLPSLQTLLFQRGLGSTLDKVERTRKIAAEIARNLDLDLATTQKIDRACLLSKSDLLTSMVYEFPEIQGVMGRIYGLLQGEDPLVCEAIELQYSDTPFASVVSGVVALADKLDVISGNFRCGNIPSGSKDPHGLRKKMSVIMETLCAFHWDLDLLKLFEFASTLEIDHKGDYEGIKQEIESFGQGRLESMLIEESVRFDTIRAVLHLWNQPLRASLAARAIESFRHDPSFSTLIVGFERVHNITKSHRGTQYDTRLFEHDEERSLLAAYYEVREEVHRHIRQLNYDLALKSLSRLKDPVDQYFDTVFVMVDREDLRLTRLGFLKELDLLFMKVGDLSCLEERSAPQTHDMQVDLDE